MVKYFSGPTRWTSANFQLSSWQESAELYEELRENKDVKIPVDSLQHIAENHFHLYKVFSNNPKMVIRIFAGNGSLLTE